MMFKGRVMIGVSRLKHEVILVNCYLSHSNNNNAQYISCFLKHILNLLKPLLYIELIRNKVAGVSRIECEAIRSCLVSAVSKSFVFGLI